MTAIHAFFTAIYTIFTSLRNAIAHTLENPGSWGYAFLLIGIVIITAIGTRSVYRFIHPRR